MGAELESRDLDKQRLTEADLEELIGNRDFKEFLNARNEGAPALAHGGHPADGKGAESHSQAGGHPRFADRAGF
jgi:hypothetical protein